MDPLSSAMTMGTSHPAWGEWIEICDSIPGVRVVYRLTPHGVSGLKSFTSFCMSAAAASHPAWGEWIEIPFRSGTLKLSRSLTPHGVSGLKY